MTLFSHWTGDRGWPQASGLTPHFGLPWCLSHPPLLPSVSKKHCPSSFPTCARVFLCRGHPGSGAPLPGRLPYPREHPLGLSAQFPGPICTAQALDEHLAAGIRRDRQKSRINYPDDSGEPGLTRLLRGRAAAQRVRGVCVVQIPGWEPVCGSPWWRGEPGGNKR